MTRLLGRVCSLGAVVAIAGCGPTTATSSSPSLAAGSTSPAASSSPAPGTVVIAQLGIQFVAPSDAGTVSYSIGSPTSAGWKWAGYTGMQYAIDFSTATLDAASKARTCAYSMPLLVTVGAFQSDPSGGSLANQPQFSVIGKVGNWWLAAINNDQADGCGNTATEIASKEIPEVEAALKAGTASS